MRPTAPVHHSHAPAPTSAAIRNLLELELKFAALRDQLYVERMEEAAAEEEMILKGESAVKGMRRVNAVFFRNAFCH